MERGIRRRLERMGEPEVFHPIEPSPEVGFPEAEKEAATSNSDVARRAIKLMKLKKAGAEEDLRHELAKPQPAPEAKALRKLVRKGDTGAAPEPEQRSEVAEIKLGDSVAAQARRLKKRGK